MVAETKICRVCDQAKALDEFHLFVPSTGQPYRSAKCRDCGRAYNRTRRARVGRDAVNSQARAIAARHPEARRAKNLRVTFGITIEQYNEMLERQDGLCAICRGEETRTYKGVVRALALDHDHATGQVRGLLCAACNSVLGFARDDESTLRAALDYLVASRAQHRTTEVTP